MSKCILITGSTDGIGFLSAKMLLSRGYTVLLHGRSQEKLEYAMQTLRQAVPNVQNQMKGYLCDLSRIKDVPHFADTVLHDFPHIDGLINNAGVFTMKQARTEEGFDARFSVNTISPYVLTRKLMHAFTPESRVINLSSAAQMSVDLNAFLGQYTLSDNEGYAQSKLALTMWTYFMASKYKYPAFIAVNPKSFLDTKMVKSAYGVAGSDMSVGADILVRLVISKEFDNISGQYFDNDIERFGNPHPDALNTEKNKELVMLMDEMLFRNLGIDLSDLL